VVIAVAGIGFTGVGGGPSARLVMGVLVGVLGGVTALYYFVARATKRAHRWAPLTMTILYLLFVAGHLASLALTGGSSRPEEMIGSVIAIIFAGLFAYVSWSAFAAIPDWRAQPAWCQELIVQAGL
jgi:drug/metabolite transporter (DMT)-like permease